MPAFAGMTNETLALVRRFEGRRERAYRDPRGKWTICYGHTASRIQPGLRLSASRCEALLHQDLERFAAGVRRLVRVALDPNQFGALVSFAFNVGLGAFAQSSVLDRINRGQFGEALSRLAHWNKARGKRLPGLARRRAAEARLFSQPGDHHAQPQ